MLPPGLDSATFAQARAAFVGAIGREFVYADVERDLKSYRDPYAIVDDDHFMPSAALAPDSVVQVQACLKIANQYRIPVWPISCGRNLAYGGPAPRLSGTVMLDLKRMNKILKVNADFGYALVEPGVSFFDLYTTSSRKG